MGSDVQLLLILTPLDLARTGTLDRSTYDQLKQQVQQLKLDQKWLQETKAEQRKVRLTMSATARRNSGKPNRVISPGPLCAADVTFRKLCLPHGPLKQTHCLS